MTTTTERHRTFSFTAARDGDLFQEDFNTTSLEEAQRMALAAVNKAWRTDYATYDDMQEDHDGGEMVEHPAVMDDRQPLALTTHYFMLAEGLREMIESGRLEEGSIPDDFDWLQTRLAQIAEMEGGQPDDAILEPIDTAPHGNGDDA